MTQPTPSKESLILEALTERARLMHERSELFQQMRDRGIDCEDLGSIRLSRIQSTYAAVGFGHTAHADTLLGAIAKLLEDQPRPPHPDGEKYLAGSKQSMTYAERLAFLQDSELGKILGFCYPSDANEPISD